MAAEAGVSITVKSARGDLITLRGDTASEFSGNAYQLLGADAGQQLVEFVKGAFLAVLPAVNAAPALQAVPDEAQAVQNVVQAFPGSTVGQPLPQPGAEQPAVQGSSPEAAPQPGETRVINGELKKWVPAGVSTKTGKPYKGFWGKP